MTKEEFNKKYVGERIVVHCKTEELADELLKRANEFGYQWNSKKKFIDINGWHIEKENTCYRFYNGKYATLQFYKSQNYKIIEFNGFEQEKE